jgi:hypothetical protein
MNLPHLNHLPEAGMTIIE